MVEPAGGAPTARLRMILHGHVQGVGFRATTLDVAARHRVTGFVRNCWDGTVEIVAEGPEAALDAFAAALRRTTVFRYVLREESRTGEATGEFHGFSVGHER
jgi:acylphosphatase